MSGLDRTVSGSTAGATYVTATARLGAVRYRCPDSGSFVLLTEPGALRLLSARPVRCAGCGGEHRLLRADETCVESAA